jgi:hypothetical protein
LQIFDLNSQQQQWLANHLGHSMDIHKIHYRQTSGLIERIDMAKLMLMQELNITAKYAGKKLEDIQLPGIYMKVAHFVTKMLLLQLVMFLHISAYLTLHSKHAET